MKQVATTAIVLSRRNYAEADRIVTLLTPDHGKVTAIAKGVRKTKSKLAGGIELFSVSDVTFIVGRSSIRTLTSTRLNQNYGFIGKDYARSSAGFEILKTLDNATDDQPDSQYYELLRDSFAGLNDAALDPELVELWFYSQLLRLEGRQPSLQLDSEHKLAAAFEFDFSTMSFRSRPEGPFSVNNIKLLRLLSGNGIAILAKIKDAPRHCGELLALVRQINKFIT